MEKKENPQINQISNLKIHMYVTYVESHGQAAALIMESQLGLEGKFEEV